MKLIDTAVEKALGASSLLKQVIVNVGTLASQVITLATAIQKQNEHLLEVTKHVEAHTLAINELYAAVSLVARDATEHFDTFADPKHNADDKPSKPN